MNNVDDVLPSYQQKMNTSKVCGFPHFQRILRMLDYSFRCNVQRDYDNRGSRLVYQTVSSSSAVCLYQGASYLGAFGSRHCERLLRSRKISLILRRAEVFSAHNIYNVRI